jgi:hypothetical protein
MFGTYGNGSANNFIIGSETANTNYTFKQGLGIQPIDLAGGTTLFTVQSDGQLVAPLLQNIAYNDNILTYATGTGLITTSSLPGSANQVIYRNGSNIISGNNNFTYDDATSILNVIGQGVFDNTSYGSTGDGTYYWDNSTSGAIAAGPLGTLANVSVTAVSYISSAGYIVTSDERIKTNINIIDTVEALETIRRITPKSFNYIDVLNQGSQKIYGFIAQDIEKENENLINKKTNYIPNIYRKCEVDIIGNISIPAELIDKLNILDYILIIEENDKVDARILHINKKNNTIFCKEIKGRLITVFVYGTKVDDFRHVKEDNLFALNFAATKELDNIIKKQNERIEILENQVTELLKLLKK